MNPIRLNKRTRKIVGNTVAYVILIFFSVLFLVPLVWMVFTSFKDYAQNNAYPPSFLPDPWYWGNYGEALFEVIPYFRYFFNSVLIVVIGVIATVVTCTMVAYGFARFHCRENKVFFVIVLSTMMLPTQVTMISSYWIWAQVQLVDTYVPLLIGSFFGGSAFYIFMVRQFNMSVPKDFEEAARVDGAGTVRIFLTIVLPVLKPALAAVAIFSFQGFWNDYMGPLIYIKDPDLYTVAQALTLYQMPQETLWGDMMAAALVTILPIVFCFAFCQKYFIQGITLGGVKG